jgi:hypothetical protein
VPRGFYTFTVANIPHRSHPQFAQRTTNRRGQGLSLAEFADPRNRSRKGCKRAIHFAERVLNDALCAQLAKIGGSRKDCSDAGNVFGCDRRRELMRMRLSLSAKLSAVRSRAIRMRSARWILRHPFVLRRRRLQSRKRSLSAHTAGRTCPRLRLRTLRCCGAQFCADILCRFATDVRAAGAIRRCSLSVIALSRQVDASSVAASSSPGGCRRKKSDPAGGAFCLRQEATTLPGPCMESFAR